MGVWGGTLCHTSMEHAQGGLLSKQREDVPSCTVQHVRLCHVPWNRTSSTCTDACTTEQNEFNMYGCHVPYGYNVPRNRTSSTRTDACTTEQSEQMFISLHLFLSVPSGEQTWRALALSPASGPPRKPIPEVTVWCPPPLRVTASRSCPKGLTGHHLGHTSWRLPLKVAAAF